MLYCIGRYGELTLKKSWVEDDSRVPYSTSVCLARSSAELIGVTIRSTVRNAAKLAVYDEMMINVKNHQTPPTMRPATDLKLTEAIANEGSMRGLAFHSLETSRGRRQIQMMPNAAMVDDLLFSLCALNSDYSTGDHR